MTDDMTGGVSEAEEPALCPCGRGYVGHDPSHGGRPSAALANQWVMEGFIERLPKAIRSKERTSIELIQAAHIYLDELVLDIRRGQGLAARNTTRILRVYVDELDRRIEEGQR